MEVSFNGSLNATFSDHHNGHWVDTNNGGVNNKSLLISIVSTPPSSGGGGGPSARDFYLGIRFIILICVFVSVYLIIWLAQRQLTKAFEKSHESQSGDQRNRNLLCPLLFLLPMTTRTGGAANANNTGLFHPSCGRRRCPCPQMASYDVRNYIGWNSSASNNHNWASRNTRCGDDDSRRESEDDFAIGNGGSSPPKYEDILLLSPGDVGVGGDLFNPPSYEDAKRMRGEEQPPSNAYLV